MTIQVPMTHARQAMTSRDVIAECEAKHGVEEVSDAAAAIIASWWQSPGSVGHVLAGFASGAPVDRDELAADVSATIAQHYAEASPQDRLCLDMLGTWVLSQPA